ncbi:MAG: hypothetical protein WB507_02295 [Solirubrobacterales bacterium]
MGGVTESRLVRKAVRLAREGDSEALHFLYVRFAADVLACLRAEVGEAGEAERLCRELFRDLDGLLEGHEIGREPFRTWLLRVARGVALRHSRAKPPSLPLGA